MRAEVAGGPGRTEADDDAPLARRVGRKVLLLFVVGDILGAGIYALTGKVAGQVGGALWVPFLVAFGLAALTATSYVELVSRYPRAAGAALYANRAPGSCSRRGCSRSSRSSPSATRRSST